ncbi:hypothetical protein BD626DRAFT_487343 [Schizophyllum amplum]|uniref:Uncharacterized protein n=1 Tax=Schizophyllum amplum TaxID=97359 RepID=A0A550CNB9_9AGAR|nr:hypothetical protein BD626DRAFT_487343 [Auriculariopsis ampla]
MSYPTNIGPTGWPYTPYQGNSYHVPAYAQPQNNPPPFIPRNYPHRASAPAGGAPNGYFPFSQGGQATPSYGQHVPIQDSLNPPDIETTIPRPKKHEPRHRKTSSAPKSAMKRSATVPTTSMPVPEAGKEPFPSYGHTPQEGTPGTLHRHHTMPDAAAPPNSNGNGLHRQRTHSNPQLVRPPYVYPPSC